MENMRILVEIGYMDFKFDDVEKAVDFAKTALANSVEDKRVEIKITFGEDE